MEPCLNSAFRPNFCRWPRRELSRGKKKQKKKEKKMVDPIDPKHIILNFSKMVTRLFNRRNENRTRGAAVEEVTASVNESLQLAMKRLEATEQKKRELETAMLNIGNIHKRICRRPEIGGGGVVVNTICAVFDESETEQTITNLAHTQLETAEAQLESTEQNLKRLEQVNARVQMEDWNVQRMRVMDEFHREWGVEGENNDGDATDGRGG
jgi:hypothetical protein